DRGTPHAALIGAKHRPHLGLEAAIIGFLVEPLATSRRIELAVEGPEHGANVILMADEIEEAAKDLAAAAIEYDEIVEDTIGRFVDLGAIVEDAGVGVTVDRKEIAMGDGRKSLGRDDRTIILVDGVQLEPLGRGDLAGDAHIAFMRAAIDEDARADI